MIPTVYIMCGLPFSGKTTLSKTVSNYLNIPRISFDEVWVEIEKENGVVPGKNSIEQWEYISQVCEQRVINFSKQGTSVVFDNLGDKVVNRDHIKKNAQQNNAESIIIYLDVSKEEVLKRRVSNLTTKKRHQVS